MANMFGALNRFIARLDSDPNSTPSASAHLQSTPNASAFQVLRNPDANLPLDPWFDFIIGINGHNIESPDPALFTTEVRNCAGATISLGVYGGKGRVVREEYVTVPAEGGLGLTLQWAPLGIVDDVWHILDVMPNSPADVAGLLPYGDYVVGSPDRAGPMRGDAGLGELVEEFLDRPLRLFVYNQEYDVTRSVTITPAKNWGGEGALGCVLGYGALHRIPAPLNEPSQAPGETLFDTASPPAANAAETPFQQGPPAAAADYLVPANLAFPNAGGVSPPPRPGSGAPPPSGKARKQRAHHPAPGAGGAATDGLDDYFAEGEQQSREIDNAPAAKAVGGVPPPPKAGPPKKATSPAPENDP